YSRKSVASLRVDANISTTGERVEIKNIGSIKDVEKALQEEIKRQQHNPVKIQETRGWDPERQNSFLMRTKESEQEYGYIFDSNLTKIVILREDIEKVKQSLPELADAKTQRLVKQYQLKTEDAKVITSDLTLAVLFEKVSEKVDHNLTARWFVREIPKVLNYKKFTLQNWGISEKEIIELLKLVEKKTITETVAQKILYKLSENLFSPKEYVEKERLSTIYSEKEIERTVETVLKENKKAAEDCKKGEEKSINFLIGQVMKITRGTADPVLVRKIIYKKTSD
ncbi:MAG: Asp-tRNA(Asn)/Glu-tRNA(Gln) amidotransferase GatCAB subunit B, partial [Patescibacteria group bacterium]